MKKVIVIGIVAAMVMGLSGVASAYILGASAKNSAGSQGMTNLQFGDPASSTAAQPTAVGGTVELGLAADQTWSPAAGADAQTWYYKLLQKPGPSSWTIALWGNSYTGGDATFKLWVTQIGNGGTTGTNITDQSWELKSLATDEVLWTGVISANSTEAAPLVSLVLPVVNTTTPHTNAAAYSFAPVVPEPGSMLALGSGLVGLVGFAIRRRK